MGIKGVRINAVSAELTKNYPKRRGEKRRREHRCVRVFEQIQNLIARAMAPAIANSIKISDNKALVYIAPIKSKAIGRGRPKHTPRIDAQRLRDRADRTQDAAGEKKVSTEEGLKNLEALFGGL